MNIVFDLVVAALVIGLYEVYRAHKNHVAFKTEATADLALLKDRITYLERYACQYAAAISKGTTPPPTA